MTQDQPKKTKIHGHTVYYDKDTEKAVKYLKYDLDYKEAKVFLEHAKHHSDGAQFEDEHERNFTLKYKSGRYTLERR